MDEDDKCLNDSSNSSAPREFRLSYEQNGPALPQHKCKLCLNPRTKFYCADCVIKGLFFHSRSQLKESFSEKRKALLQLQDGRRALEKKCLKLMECHLRIDSLYTRIRQCRERGRLLRLSVEERRKNYKQMVFTKQTLQEMILKCHEKKIPRCRSKCELMSQTVTLQRTRLSELYSRLEAIRSEMRRFIRIRVNQLKYVFPITKIQPKPECSDSGDVDDVVKALAEASRTTYIWNRWEYLDNSGELQFSVVEPTLPGSGNYTPYNVWVSQNKDVIPANSSTHQQLREHNSALNIGAALTYTAQLIQVLAFYFNVRLPYRMIYSKFMSESQFRRRVARLNANVLYLCYTQHVDLSCLRPTETIHNLLKVLDTTSPQLGSSGPYVNSEVQFEMNLCKDLQITDDNESDDGDSFHAEWEAVNFFNVPHISDVPTQTVGIIQNMNSNSQILNTQQTVSVAGGLVNSIASIWRGFSGK